MKNRCLLHPNGCAPNNFKSPDLFCPLFPRNWGQTPIPPKRGLTLFTAGEEQPARHQRDQAVKERADQRTDESRDCEALDEFGDEPEEEGVDDEKEEAE